MRGKLKIFACRAGEVFANRIVTELNKINSEVIGLAKYKVEEFSDGELKTTVLDNVRGCDVFLVQNLVNKVRMFDVNTNIMETLIFIDALKRAKPKHITLVIPYFAYARQDKPREQEPVSSALMAKLITTAGVDEVLTMDLHNDAIIGSFDPNKATIDNLYPAAFKEYFRDRVDVFAATDAGGAPKAAHYAKHLGKSMAIGYKERDYSTTDVVKKLMMIGDVADKNVAIIDDIISTGGSMKNCAEELKKTGAKDIYMACSHPIFVGKAEKIFSEIYSKGIIKEVIGTDSIIQPKEFFEKNPWFRQISVADVFAKAILDIHKEGKVSSFI